MALALLPVHYPDRSLYNPLPSPDILLATAAMEQARKTRPSLPSISSLIEAVAEKSDKRNDPSPKYDPSRRVSGGSQGNRPSSEQPNISETVRNLPPPTPELPPASSFDFHRPSPTNISPITATSRGSFYSPNSAGTKPETYAQRPSAYSQNHGSISSYPPVTDHSHWPSAPILRLHTDALQQEQAPRPPPGVYNEVSPDARAYNSLSHQRPLPVNFPPPIAGQGLPPIDAQITPTWQHHHYYPPANPPAYPQSQERYICPTCNKPFSRPSSLKIHIYSHTGEKPYKCKHEGCGKYFSVRSNMKRHEKGCHGGTITAATGTSPKTG